LSKLGSKGSTTSAVALVVATAMTAMMLLFTGGSPANSATGQAAGAAGTMTRIAHDPQGVAKSAISGRTKSGKRVTGYFTPMSVSKHDGHLRMRGLVTGVVHKASGKSRTFSAVRTFRVKSLNGTRPGAQAPATAAAAAGSCRILHLVLAPLHLNLLGLKVHLARVLLNVAAQSGAGQLLGNLLCAVAHLLDNGGTLSQLLNKLSSILDQLLLGL
jgi:hypothetical protein